MKNQTLVSGNSQSEPTENPVKRNGRKYGVAALYRHRFSLARLFAKSQPRHKVLIVDDEPLAREACSEAFEDAGMKAVCAESCGEALKKMEETPVDALLLDIELEDENGLSFLPKFKACYPDVPVVMFTGLGYDNALMETARANGAAGYVSKGAAIENLVASIRNIFGRKSALPA